MFDVIADIENKLPIVSAKTIIEKIDLNNAEVIEQFNEYQNAAIFGRFKERKSIEVLLKKPWNLFLLLKKKRNLEPFGIIWILVDDDLQRIATLHGGTWKTKENSSIYSLDAWKSIIRLTSEMNIKLLSSCNKHNTAAEKFLIKTGFKVNEESAGFLYFSYIHDSHSADG